MSYSVSHTTDLNKIIYINADGTRSCIDADPEFQQWLRDNQDNLPDDIQAKIDAGTLTIAEAD
jgi:hypothetical protein|tara:strand:- start:12 stop:200 length:189 start_codon:yes stop_codon:yes gene_type:complete